MNSQSGQQLIGNAANGLNSFCIRVEYPVPFDIEPIVNVTVCGDGYFDDVCVATVHSSNKHGFSVNVKRAFEELQSSRWTQNLSLYWIANAMDSFNGKMTYTEVEEGEENIVLEIPIDDTLFSDEESLPRVMVTPVGGNEQDAPYVALQIKEVRRNKVLLSTRILSCPLRYLEINYSLSHSTQPNGQGLKSSVSYIGDISATSDSFIKRTVRFSTSYPVPPHIVVVPVSDPHHSSNQVVAVNVQNVTAQSFTAVIRKFEQSNIDQILYLHYYTQIPREFENAIDTSELFTSVVSSWSRPSLPVLILSPSKASFISDRIEYDTQSTLSMDRSNLENFDLLEEAGLIKEIQEITQIVENEREEEKAVPQTEEQSKNEHTSERTPVDITHSPVIRELENYPSPLLNRLSYKSVKTITKLQSSDELQEANMSQYLQASASELYSSPPPKPREAQFQESINEQKELVLESVVQLNNDEQKDDVQLTSLEESPEISQILVPEDSTLITGQDNLVELDNTKNEPNTPHEKYTSLIVNVSFDQEGLSNITTPVKSITMSPINRSFVSLRSAERTPSIHSSPRNASPVQSPMQMQSPVRSIISRLKAEGFGSKKLEIVRDHMDGVVVNLNGLRVIEILHAIPMESNRLTALEIIVYSNKYQVDGFDVVRILNLFILNSRKREVMNLLFGNTKNPPLNLNCGSSVLQILQLLSLENHKLEVLQLMSPSITEKTDLSVQVVLSQFKIKANIEKAKSLLNEGEDIQAEGSFSL